jgi:hypothetical protein
MGKQASKKTPGAAPKTQAPLAKAPSTKAKQPTKATKAKKAKKAKTLRLTGIHYKPEVLKLLEKFEEAFDKVPKKLESLDDLQLKCDAVEALEAYRTKYVKLKSARDTNVERRREPAPRAARAQREPRPRRYADVTRPHGSPDPTLSSSATCPRTLTMRTATSERAT